MNAKIYYEKDSDINQIKDKTICVLGYGSQGRAHARNLHDSGLDVVVGLREGSKTFAKVEADGLRAAPAQESRRPGRYHCLPSARPLPARGL